MAGKRGRFKGSSGLSLAYLSGVESSESKSSDTTFGDQDVSHLVLPVSTDTKFKGVDILITSQWPDGVEKYGSDIYLYAFSITPLSEMEESDLTRQPDDVTECPYKISAISSKQDGSKNEQQFFYDMKSGDEKGKKRQREDGDRRPPKKHPQPTGPCWFCLGSPEVEKHLVVSVGTQVYLALAKGGLVDDHTLILPIGHHQSTVLAPGEAVPIPTDCIQEVKDTFMECAEAESFELHEIPKHSDLKQIVPPGAPYFYAELPTGDKLLHRISKNFPLQFGREVLACPQILNMPERVDWKACKISKDQESDNAKYFRTTFEPFDFNN
ncbi:hypothetical protein FSP39_020809 [Pinctada imbricata]|uniref:CWF19-like protein 1 n=1 Tax=Pinctada imbricata TaxID=66713 RepID=A0AA88YS37_PINIB|nr:hypothetical protein FSP39_020809 [Pinctada imbricata]